MRVLVDDFYNKFVTELKRIYFPNDNHGLSENKNYRGALYTVELFSNGCMTYNTLLNKLSKYCGRSKTEIHSILSKYINSEFNFTIKGTK
jgi:hypothetical protein